MLVAIVGDKVWSTESQLQYFILSLTLPSASFARFVLMNSGSSPLWILFFLLFLLRFWFGCPLATIMLPWVLCLENKTILSNEKHLVHKSIVITSKIVDWILSLKWIINIRICISNQIKMTKIPGDPIKTANNKHISTIITETLKKQKKILTILVR